MPTLTFFIKQLNLDLIIIQGHVSKQMQNHEERQKTQVNHQTPPFQIQHLLMVICAVAFIFLTSGLTTMFRHPTLITSVKIYLNQSSTYSLKQKILELLRIFANYVIIGTALIIFYGYSVLKVCKRREIKPRPRESDRAVDRWKLFLLIMLIIAVHCWNWSVSQQTRQDYQQFYSSFKEGSNNTEINGFKGFKQYYYLSHFAETTTILDKIQHSSSNPEAIAIAQNMHLLIKKQDKSISTFRSFLGNHLLLIKIINIAYYFCANVFFAGLLIALLIYSFGFKSSNKNQPINYQIISHEEQHESIQPKQHIQIATYKMGIFILISVILALMSFLSLMAADLFQEINNGNRLSGNSEQTQLCSFHHLSGGVMMNIDFQTELQIDVEMSSLKQMLQLQHNKNNGLFDDLYAYMQVYQQLCRNLNPYYQQHRQIQSSISLLFYRMAFFFPIIQYLITQLYSTSKKAK